MAFSNTYAVILILLMLTSGCTVVTQNETPVETQEESEEVVEMNQSVQLIMEAGGIDLDSAQGTAETLADLGVPLLEKAEPISSKTGVVLRAVDEDGQVYYLGFGGLGYLEIVRRDSADGEIIYAPEE